jgi:hypothetical protein
MRDRHPTDATSPTCPTNPVAMRSTCASSRAARGQGTKLISVRGGTAPRWSAKGDELFFIADDTLTAVSVKLAPRFSAGLPQALFTAAKVGVDGSQGFGYDAATDGRRFVVVRTLSRPERHAVVIENWRAKARQGQ